MKFNIGVLDFGVMGALFVPEWPISQGLLDPIGMFRDFRRLITNTKWAFPI